MAGVRNISMLVHNAVYWNASKTIWVDEVERGGKWRFDAQELGLVFKRCSLFLVANIVSTCNGL